MNLSLFQCIIVKKLRRCNMTVAFFTLGCKVNQYESELMREDLNNHNYQVVDIKENPDIIVINSCTVTAESDRKTRQMVRKHKKLYPNSVVVLTGCMPQAFPDKAKELDSADIVLGNGSNDELIEALNEYFATNKQVFRVHQHNPEIVNSTICKFRERTKAFLKIEDGCNRFCSYCIIPTARGRVRSKSLENIKSEVLSLANEGFKEVVLIGINLSAYGKDTEYNLADAVETAASIDGIERVRLGSLEPDQITDDMIDRLSKIDKLCPQFHLSLQSGCDKTLKAMNRHYDTSFYRNLIKQLREKFENCAITTDIMVGFPGETDDDFEESLSFAKEIGFSQAHIFAYSRRKGTVADKMSEQLTTAIKHSRSQSMIEATNKTKEEFMNNQIGKVFPVLYESKNCDGVYEGYTPNYTLVKTKFDYNPCGKIIDTIILETQDDYCIGKAN